MFFDAYNTKWTSLSLHHNLVDRSSLPRYSAKHVKRNLVIDTSTLCLARNASNRHQYIAATGRVVRYKQVGARPDGRYDLRSRLPDNHWLQIITVMMKHFRWWNVFDDVSLRSSFDENRLDENMRENYLLFSICYVFTVSTAFLIPENRRHGTDGRDAMRPRGGDHIITEYCQMANADGMRSSNSYFLYRWWELTR